MNHQAMVGLGRGTTGYTGCRAMFLLVVVRIAAHSYEEYDDSGENCDNETNYPRLQFSRNRVF